MFGEDSRVNSLSARKQLLIAESDLNRTGLLDEMAELTASANTLGARARSFGWIGSSAALLMAGFAAIRHRRPAPATTGFSWRKSLLKATGLLSSLYLASRRWNRNGTHRQW
jgi:hypothetical protein